MLCELEYIESLTELQKYLKKSTTFYSIGCVIYCDI